MMPGIGDPDDDHPNPVGDAVVKGVRSLLRRLGPAGRRAAASLPGEEHDRAETSRGDAAGRRPPR
jgi:hypothetical protein